MEEYEKNEFQYDDYLYPQYEEAEDEEDKADILEKSGIHSIVVDARFLKPFDKTLARRLAKFRQYTIENHSISGGLYSALIESCAGIAHAPISGFGWPDDEIIGHGEVGKLREKYGLTAAAIAEKIGAENSVVS